MSGPRCLQFIHKQTNKQTN